MNPRATYQTQPRNIEGWFIDILPDFNQDDPEVEKYLIQNSIWWLDIGGFDAIRMDTLPHVPRTFWAKMGNAIKREYPKVNILGELFDGDPALISYFQTGREASMGLIQRSIRFTISRFFIRSAMRLPKANRFAEVSQMFAHDRLYPNPNVLTTFIGVHDMARFMSEKGATIDGLKLAQTLIMTTRGTPFLYYGDEIAMPGGGDPDNRRDFPGGFPGDGINKFAPSAAQKSKMKFGIIWQNLANYDKKMEPLRRGKTWIYSKKNSRWLMHEFTEIKPLFVIINNDNKACRSVDLTFR